MTAIFWGTFAATRGFAIVLAMVAKPALVMWGSYAISLVGAILLSIFANSSPAALYFGTAMMGIGCASIFPTGFLWMEQRIVITSKVRNQHITDIDNININKSMVLKSLLWCGS